MLASAPFAPFSYALSFQSRVEQPLGLIFSTTDVAPFWALHPIAHEFGGFSILADKNTNYF